MYPSIVDIVVATNERVQKRIFAHNYEYIEFYVSVQYITQKNHLLENQSGFIIQRADLSQNFGCVGIYLDENQSVFIIQRADLSHNFGCVSEQNQIGVIRKGKGLQYSYDIIRRHSLIVYSDIIDYI